MASSKPSHAMIDKASCTVYIKTVQGAIMRTIFEVLRDVVFDSNMIISPTGLKIAAMDTAKCSLVYLRLFADNFEDFHCSSETRIGLNMSCIHKLIKSAGSHDTVTLFIENGSSHELGIIVEKPEKSRTIFRLKLLDIDGADINVPQFEFDSVITLPSTTFQRLCRDMQNVAPLMTIESSGKSLSLSCMGDFASQTTVLGGGDDEEDDGDMVIQSASTDIIRGTYSLKYLTLFGRASSLSNAVTLFIKKNHPLVIEYNAGTLGSLKFLLTPVVEAEEEEEDDEDA